MKSASVFTRRLFQQPFQSRPPPSCAGGQQPAGVAIRRASVFANYHAHRRHQSPHGIARPGFMPRILMIGVRHHRPLSSSSLLQKASDDLPLGSAAPPRAIMISEEDMDLEESKRQRLSEVLIEQVLKAKHSYRWVDPIISRTATVRDAIVTVIEGGLSGMMVLEENNTDNNNNNNNDVDEGEGRHTKKRVVGLLTSRDLLRIMASGIKDGTSNDEIMNKSVGNFMTPISQVIYGRPEETVGMCRTIMAKLGIKCLPILSRDGRVEGLLTARDMSDFGLSAKDKGGKKSYLNDVSQRVGLSSDTSMAEPPTYLKAHLALEQSPLYINCGLAALPHPFKTNHGVARSLREMDGGVHSSDPSLSEDASFVTTVTLPDGKDKTLRSFTYLGVADGVGSWREYNVDPREFSHRLMEECENILQEASRDNGTGHGHHNTDGQTFRQVIAPAELMARAYERVKVENIIGSTTACVGVFDGIRHQLHFSNLGDSGLIVLRHIDSDVAGSLKRDRITPRYERVSDLRLAFVSQQQLRSFNHPFQLGWTGRDLLEGESTSFKAPSDACTSSVHVRRGDIVIMATDGLFDNVDVEDICAMALHWEQANGFMRGGDIVAREKRWQMGNSMAVLSSEKINDLATILCDKARESSLDPTIDSPFAVLAKENDIMWSGGMPDDCTVLALHIVGRDSHDVMDVTNQ